LYTPVRTTTSPRDIRPHRICEQVSDDALEVARIEPAHLGKSRELRAEREAATGALAARNPPTLRRSQHWIEFRLAGQLVICMS